MENRLNDIISQINQPFERDQATNEQNVQDYINWLDTLWSERVQPGQYDLTVGILLWPGFSMMSLSGIVESLRHAGDFSDHSQQKHCRWKIMGQKGHKVKASCGIEIEVTQDYMNPNDFDYIFAIGGLLGEHKRAPKQHNDYLLAAAQSETTIIGVCTGVFVLARLGLLSNKTACLHPFHSEEFQLAFPGHKMTTQQDYVIDKNRITVPGGISILSLMAAIIKQHCGPNRASKTVYQLSLSEKRILSEFDKTRLSGFRDVRDPRIQKALVLIEDRVRKKANEMNIAHNVGLSDRHFSRLFKEQTGFSPKQYIVQTRLRYANWLLTNTTLSITSIALETGFTDCAHFSNSYRNQYKHSPKETRNST